MASTDYDRVIVLGQRLGMDEVLGKFYARQCLTELRLSRLGLTEIPPGGRPVYLFGKALFERECDCHVNAGDRAARAPVVPGLAGKSAVSASAWPCAARQFATSRSWTQSIHVAAGRHPGPVASFGAARYQRQPDHQPAPDVSSLLTCSIKR